MASKQPKPPARRPLPDHLARTLASGVIPVVIITLLVAAMATSRATAHVLSPLALALIVAGAAGTGVLVGWPSGLYNGAHDILTGAAVLGCEPGCRAEPGNDPWRAGALWRSTAAWALLVALWAGAGAALVAVALNGKQARLIVVFVALAAFAGASGLVIDAVARHRGAHAARRVLALEREPDRIRTRGWRQIALPLAITQLVVNAGFAWVLFHSYAVHAPSGTPHALTKSVALADVMVRVALVAVIFGAVAAKWGATDALLGRATVDEANAQTATAKNLVGPQGIVYVAILAILVEKLTAMLLPSSPTLLQVAIARGAFAGMLTFAAAGAGYVRGAVNGRATRAAGTRTSPIPTLTPAEVQS